MKNIRSVDLNLLVAFDALFDERSVTRAAERLAVTQPTVSGLLKRLRRTFSDQLFLRTSHGILPTPRAEALAGPVKNLLASAQSLVTPETFDPAVAETTIKICGSDYLQNAVISPLIKAIRKLLRRSGCWSRPGQTPILWQIFSHEVRWISVSAPVRLCFQI